MKNKGFTLVELMGVIIILSVLLFIAAPTVRELISSSKEELYEIQINNIEEGLKNWAIDNNRILPKNEGQSITITLGQLKMGGFIESELKNPKTDKCFGNDMTLTIRRYQKNYIYEVNEETGIETENCGDYVKPYMILNGDSVVYVEIGEIYNELGVVALDSYGNDISNRVTKNISGDGTIDTSVIGNKYIITYSVTASDNTTSVNRTVIVRDTVAPELIIPENAILEQTTTSFDVMEGVSAIDNSGETITVTAKSNISFGIPGEYMITYTAKDSSGNKNIKNRIVTIKAS